MVLCAFFGFYACITPFYERKTVFPIFYGATYTIQKPSLYVNGSLVRYKTKIAGGTSPLITNNSPIKTQENTFKE